jgi:tetratricopeptide (TPR) repeat protein
MPISTTVHVSQCLALILQTDPASVLDVGCGFGTWGFLCRTQLDVGKGNVQPETWQRRIDGLEYFEPYIQSHHRSLYDQIIIGDIRDLAATIDRYDLIIAGDVIEHLEKDEAKLVVEQLYEKADKALLINIPLGEGWDHPEQHGNPGELHRSKWCPEDFQAYPSRFDHFTLPCGDYGVFYCNKYCEKEDRVRGLLGAALYADQQQQPAEALRYLASLYKIDPVNRDMILLKTDLLIRSQSPQAAVQYLRQVVESIPDCHEAALALIQLLRSIKQVEESREVARRLLEQEGLSPETKATAHGFLKG